MHDSRSPSTLPRHLPAAAWLAAYCAVLAWSVIGPKDVFTWWLEVLPALVGLAVLGFTYRRFPLPPLLYGVILLHSMVLMVGGHYTYAEVPLFDWIRDALGQSRNNFDKLGHFMQGVTPALLARELLSRTSPLRTGKWMGFLAVCVALAFSAFYELVEWWVAVMTGEGAEAFLGTQGYAWDTQSDMLLALVGAAFAVLALARLQDGQMRRRGWIG